MAGQSVENVKKNELLVSEITPNVRQFFGLCVHKFFPNMKEKMLYAFHPIKHICFRFNNALAAANKIDPLSMNIA